ncbi:MAG TPA: YjjG family noncanonical pyrimidine nucleotidase [Saprospiraceae bacterium]|nr:YjjG family noncanonical pyrimidine nucleotidase [Saprospiraceae bacterium]
MIKTDFTQSFDWMLFDLDNTLLDFDASSKIAFHKSFQISGVKTDEEDYDNYMKINKIAWQAFTENKMDHEEIKSFRFGRLFEKMKINHLDALEFNALYFEQLVVNPVFIKDAENIIQSLNGKVRLGIISNGMKEVQRPRLEFSRLLSCFDKVFISGELGFAKPQEQFFAYVHNSIGLQTPKDRILVIGDHLEIDVKGANDYGFCSAWFNPDGLEKMNGIIPHFEIKNLNEIVHLLHI